MAVRCLLLPTAAATTSAASAFPCPAAANLVPISRGLLRVPAAAAALEAFASVPLTVGRGLLPAGALGLAGSRGAPVIPSVIPPLVLMLLLQCRPSAPLLPATAAQRRTRLLLLLLLRRSCAAGPCRHHGRGRPASRARCRSHPAAGGLGKQLES